ncbi:MAG: hypothetical protein GY765_36445 [bacterium]|nr:hypothetical protein [bacterium]
MPNKADLQIKLEILEAMPSHKVLSPTVPIHVCIQEAESLVIWSEDDRAVLEAAGLDWTLVEDIPIRAGALREAHTQWATAVTADHKDAAVWPEDSLAAIELRTVLKHKLAFAFRNTPKLLSRLRVVNKGKKQSQLMEALNHLRAMGEKHLDLLAAVNIDPAILAEAARYSDELAVALGVAQKRKEKLTKKRVLRDKAYLHLKEAVDEVRSFGKYVFWRTPEQLKGYQSAYYRALKNAAADGDTGDAPPEPTEPEPAAVELEAAAADIAAAGN